ncbi:polysaccharide deacetylase family protein [Clostridium sp. Cult2]|uniref:polysaccharide deacetylase family protein n=1 Tax=Clostridium sp. Cult2 TaxID=2079003 RepID=UPI001F40B17A|nr:polysaccharide deacetylase family protein [Clostridium sp. Cult2]MCF6465647.1 chitooligosaccharide deacetylase [Clostridium sp. Cult2]
MKKKKIFLSILFFYILIIILVEYTFNPLISTLSNNYGKIVNHGPKEEKVIALTFDDGPHPIYTDEILDVLKEYDVKATFFVLGKFAELYPDIIKRQSREGHEIGNHTYSHVDPKKVSKEKLLDEYERTQNIVTNLTNKEPKLFRPPYGSFNSNTLDVMEMNDTIIVLWSAYQDSKDWSNPKVEKIINTTLSNVKNGDIILFHDYVYYDKSNTIEALKKILPELKNRGYNFLTISELIDLETKSNE